MQFLFIGILLLITQEEEYRITTKKAIDTYFEAESYFSKEEWEKAENYFYSLIGNFPTENYDKELTLKIVECKFKNYDFKGALKILKKMWQKEKNKGWYKFYVAYGLGLIYTILHKFDSAKIYIDILDKNPAYKELSKTKFLKGLWYFTQGKYENALEYFSQDTLLPEFLLYLGRTYGRMKKITKAIPPLRKLTMDYAGTSFATYALYALGEVYYYYGDYEEAMSKFKKFLSYYPESPLADYVRYFLGTCYLNLRMYHQAVESFRPLVRHKDPLLAAHACFFLGDAEIKIGKEERNMKDLNDAVSWLERVRTEANSATVSALALFKLAEAFLYIGDTSQLYLVSSQLTEYFEYTEKDTLMKLLPAGPIGKHIEGIGPYLGGVLLYYFKDYYRAANKFMEVVEKFEKSDFAYPAAAMSVLSFVNAGDFANAKIYGNVFLKKLKETDNPWYAWLLYGIGEAYYYSGEFDKAVNFYKKVKKKFEEGRVLGLAIAGLGWSYLNQGRYEEAIKEFESLLGYSDTLILLQAYMGLGVSYFNLADISLKNGNLNLAYKYVENAVKYFENRLLKIISKEDTSCYPKALYYAGLSYEEWNRVEKASTGQIAPDILGSMVYYYELLRKNYPRSEYAASGVYRMAYLFKKYKNTRPRAVELFKWLLEHHPNHPKAPEAQYYLGECYEKMGKYEEALLAYKKTVSLYPLHEISEGAKEKILEMRYLSNVILKNYVLGDKKKIEFEVAKDIKSVKELEKFVEENPNTEYAIQAYLAIYGYYLYEKHDTLKAAEYLEKIANEFPDNIESPRYLYMSAIYYEKLRQYTKAKIAFEKMIDFYSDNQQVWEKYSSIMKKSYFHLADVYMKLNEFKKALYVLKKIKKFKNTLNNYEILTYYIYLGDAYFGAGNRKKAKNAFLQAEQIASALGSVDDLIYIYSKLYYLADNEVERKSYVEKIRALQGGG